MGGSTMKTHCFWVLKHNHNFHSEGVVEQDLGEVHVLDDAAPDVAVLGRAALGAQHAVGLAEELQLDPARAA